MAALTEHHGPDPRATCDFPGPSETKKDEEGVSAFPEVPAQLRDSNCTLETHLSPESPGRRLCLSEAPLRLLPSPRSPVLLPGQAGLSLLCLQESPEDSDSEAGVTVTPSQSSGGLETASE